MEIKLCPCQRRAFFLTTAICLTPAGEDDLIKGRKDFTQLQCLSTKGPRKQEERVKPAQDLKTGQKVDSSSLFYHLDLSEGRKGDFVIHSPFYEDINYLYLFYLPMTAPCLSRVLRTKLSVRFSLIREDTLFVLFPHLCQIPGFGSRPISKNVAEHQDRVLQMPGEVRPGYSGCPRRSGCWARGTVGGQARVVQISLEVRPGALGVLPGILEITY